MNITEIRLALSQMVGSVENEPAHTAIGRFLRGEVYGLDELAADLDKTDGCADLAAAVRAL